MLADRCVFELLQVLLPPFLLSTEDLCAEAHLFKPLTLAAEAAFFVKIPRVETRP